MNIMSILKIVKKFYIVSFLLVLCSQWEEENIYDFLPLEPGRYWKYTSGEEEEIWKILRDTIIEGISCRIIRKGIVEEFWAIGEKDLSLYVERDTNKFGVVDEVYKGFVKLIELPLLEGRTWGDTLLSKDGEESFILIGRLIKEKNRVWELEYQVFDMGEERFCKLWLEKNKGFVKRLEDNKEWILVETGVE